MRARSPVRRLAASVDTACPPLSDPEWLEVFAEAVRSSLGRRVPALPAAVAAYRAAVEVAERVGAR